MSFKSIFPEPGLYREVYPLSTDRKLPTDVSIAVLGNTRFAQLSAAAAASRSRTPVLLWDGKPSEQSTASVEVSGFGYAGTGTVVRTGVNLPDADFYVYLGGAKRWLTTVEEHARSLAGKPIAIMGGGVAASAAARHVLDRIVGTGHSTRFAEIQSFPFIGDVSSSGLHCITGVKRRMGIGSEDPEDANEIAKLLRPWLDDLVVRPYLDVTLADVNPIIHPTVCLANMRAIDRGESFIFYADGMTPSMGKLMAAMDEERRAILSAIGAQFVSLHDTLTGFYSDQGMSRENLTRALADFGPYDTSKGPADYRERFILDDVSCGLWPLVALGEYLSVPAPLCNGIKIACEVVSGLKLEEPERLSALVHAVKSNA